MRDDRERRESNGVTQRTTELREQYEVMQREREEDLRAMPHFGGSRDEAFAAIESTIEELGRIPRELGRLSGELGRMSGEFGRISEELGRISAELNRMSAELAGLTRAPRPLERLADATRNMQGTIPRHIGINPNSKISWELT